MAMTGYRGTNDATSGAASSLRRYRLRGMLRRLLTRLVVLILVLLLAGFCWFVWLVPSDEVSLKRDADGIVVLTGGASRISDAIELLAAGHGHRLLISGVHPTTTSGEITRLMPTYRKVIECCVDLGHAALNTLGNALETRQWVEQRQVRSLIVVTSSYHMPRAMAELAHQLPQVELIPFPVVSDTLRNEPWWASGATARLLASEYLKYLLAIVRMHLNPGYEPEADGLS